MVEDARWETFTGLTKGWILDRSLAIAWLGTPVQLHADANVWSVKRAAAARCISACRRGEEDLLLEEERGFYHLNGCTEKKHTVSRISLSERNGPVVARGGKGKARLVGDNKQTAVTAEKILSTTLPWEIQRTGSKKHKTYIETNVSA